MIFDRIAEFRAVRHYEAAAASDLSGTNHAVVRLSRDGKPVAIVCICGLQFWVRRGERLVQPEDFTTQDAYVRALRAQVGVAARDVSERHAHRERGLRAKGKEGKDPGGWVV